MSKLALDQLVLHTAMMLNCNSVLVGTSGTRQSGFRPFPRLASGHLQPKS
jgi:hypothetical protein